MPVCVLPRSGVADVVPCVADVVCWVVVFGMQAVLFVVLGVVLVHVLVVVVAVVCAVAARAPAWMAGGAALAAPALVSGAVHLPHAWWYHRLLLLPPPDLLQLLLMPRPPVHPSTSCL